MSTSLYPQTSPTYVKKKPYIPKGISTPYYELYNIGITYITFRRSVELCLAERFLYFSQNIFQKRRFWRARDGSALVVLTEREKTTYSPWKGVITMAKLKCPPPKKAPAGGPLAGSEAKRFWVPAGGGLPFEKSPHFI